MTIIQLIGDVQNEGINDYLELSEDVACPINMGVSDIRDLSKKKGTFSKSIKVAGTKHNNQVLNHYYDVNIETFADEFDINRIQNCCIIQDGIVILDNAVMQLIDIERNSNNSKDIDDVTYTVLIKDTVADLFTNIGNAEIKDLDFSDLNHTYNAANVIASFDHDVTDGYKYILPMCSGNNYLLQEMKAGVYAKVILDRIFERAGKRYIWTGLEDAGFDKLIIPYSGDKATLSEAAIESLLVVADRDGEGTTDFFINQADGSGLGAAGSTVPFSLALPIPNEVIDNDNLYNPTTSIYTNSVPLYSPNALVFSFVLDYAFVMTNTYSSAVTNNSNVTYVPFITVRNNTTGQLSTHNLLSRTSAQMSPLAAGDNIILAEIKEFQIAVTGVNTAHELTFFVGVAQAGVATWNQEDGFRINPTVRINDLQVTIKPSADSFGFGFPVIMNQYTPLKMKQSEYMKSIFTMFNLFPVQDDDDPNLIHLITRDEYYDSGAVKNWSKKISKERTQTITFLPDITAKKMVFSYKDDKDPLNVGYLTNVGETYGRAEFTFDNEYIKNEERKEVSFGASPFVRTQFGALVHGVNGAEPKTLPRIVYDGGKYPCGAYTITDYGTTSTTVNEYPHCTHFDKPVNPTKDFNFGQCRYYFDDGYGIAPFNNLTNTYWRRTLGQINSGKLFTAYFELNANDINELKLNDKIFVDNAYWHINKLIDYDANAKELTKVELLSADTDVTLPRFTVAPIKPTLPNADPAPVNPVTGVIGGVINPINDMMQIRQASLNLDLSQEGSVIKGIGNYIAPSVKSAIVIGDNGVITEDGVYIDGVKQGRVSDRVFKAWLEYNEITSLLEVRVQYNSIGDFTVNQTVPDVGTLEIEFIGDFTGFVPNVYIHCENASVNPRLYWGGDGDFSVDNIMLGDIKKTSISIEFYSIIETVTEIVS